MAAHHNLLQIRADMAIDERNLASALDAFLVRAGNGGFICEPHVIRSVDHNGDRRKTTGNAFYARTWISDDMLSERQIPVIPDAQPGERLGDDWLLPYALRELIADGEDVTGLPEMLARRPMTKSVIVNVLFFAEIKPYFR